MKRTRARVLRQGEYQQASAPARAAPVAAPRARLVPRVQVEALDRAQQAITEAHAQARAIVEQAEREAAQVKLSAAAEGRANAAAEFAARAIALRALEHSFAERTLDQQVQLARLLAERVLGEELSLKPERVAALARQALNESRGARHINIEAHPLDADFIQQALEALPAAVGTVQLRKDASRARGHLRVVTELGVLDAALGPQLDRLTEKLRESLKA